MREMHLAWSAMNAREHAGCPFGACAYFHQVFNRLVAAVLLVVCGPFFALLALMIWAQDGGSALFGHLRVGQHGRVFRCLKFRTMHVRSKQLLADLLASDPAAAVEWAQRRKLTHDPRVTPIGRFLRCTSLDELPQLLNVLRGEMNFVGPRPVTAQELTRYGSIRWHYLSVPPGVTGLWQVSGRNNTTYEERVALDAQYVQRRSLMLDAKILLRTVQVVLRRDGAG